MGFHNAFDVIVGCMPQQSLLKLRHLILLESETIEKSGLTLPGRMANRK